MLVLLLCCSEERERKKLSVLPLHEQVKRQLEQQRQEEIRLMNASSCKKGARPSAVPHAASPTEVHMVDPDA
jgi:hypothetical protein